MKRLVYTSSVAAYGFHADNPQPLTEDVPPRGSEAFYYSAQKAELESVLEEEIEGAGVEAYVFRPCIVAGPDAPALLNQLPQNKLPGPDLPLLPDPGVRVPARPPRRRRDRAGGGDARRRARPGIYNLAGEGTITLGDLARALGWFSVPVPRIAVRVASLERASCRSCRRRRSGSSPAACRW